MLIHFMVEAEGSTSGKYRRFIQNMVVRASSEGEGREVCARFLARQGARLIGFDEEETYTADELRVGYARLDDADVFAATGRIWFDPDAEE